MPLVCMVKEMGEQRPRHELVNGPQLCRNSKTKHRTAVLTPSRGEASHDRIAIGILEILDCDPDCDHSLPDIYYV